MKQKLAQIKPNRPRGGRGGGGGVKDQTSHDVKDRGTRERASLAASDTLWPQRY